jgi:hypothetical protein
MAAGIAVRVGVNAMGAEPLQLLLALLCDTL